MEWITLAQDKDKWQTWTLGVL